MRDCGSFFRIPRILPRSYWHIQYVGLAASRAIRCLRPLKVSNAYFALSLVEEVDEPIRGTEVKVRQGDEHAVGYWGGSCGTGTGLAEVETVK